MYCPQCGAPNPDTSQFCGQCGTRLPQLTGGAVAFTFSPSPAENRKEELERRFQRQRKSVWVAYFLWSLLFAHYGYLGKWGLQIVFWITFGGFLVWWVIDAIRMENLVNAYNDGLERRLKRELARGNRGAAS
jgi:hypothetical protein